jgi:VanZ family protein
MDTTVTTHRILASLIVVLIALLIPFGRAVERAVKVLPVAYLNQNRWIVLLAAITGTIFVAQRVLSSRLHWVHATGLALIALLAVLFLETSAEWCHFLMYGVLAIGIAGSNLHTATARFSLLLGGAIGVLDELVQGQTPGRVADPWDIVVDILGLIVGLWVFNALRSFESASSASAINAPTTPSTEWRENQGNL